MEDIHDIIEQYLDNEAPALAEKYGLFIDGVEYALTKFQSSAVPLAYALDKDYFVNRLPEDMQSFACKMFQENYDVRVYPDLDTPEIDFTIDFAVDHEKYKVKEFRAFEKRLYDLVDESLVALRDEICAFLNKINTRNI